MTVARPFREPVRRTLWWAFVAWTAMVALSVTAETRQQRTLASGVYSVEQAARGKQVYQAECSDCHGVALEGGLGPMLEGEFFLSTWSGLSLADLVGRIQDTMPFQSPGTLTREQSIDVTTYVVQVNGFPSGTTALTETDLAEAMFPAAVVTPAPAADGQQPGH